MGAVEDQIRRKGLELGFSNVGFTTVRDYPEYLEEARSRAHYDIFAGADDALITRLSETKTRNPWANATVKDPFLELLAQEFNLEKILLLDDAYYEQVVHPIMYNYIKDLDIFRRNAAVALGNSGDPDHLPALREAQANTENPDVLKSIDWAIAKLEALPTAYTL